MAIIFYISDGFWNVTGGRLEWIIWEILPKIGNFNKIFVEISIFLSIRLDPKFILRVLGEQWAKKGMLRYNLRLSNMIRNLLIILFYFKEKN